MKRAIVLVLLATVFSLVLEGPATAYPIVPTSLKLKASDYQVAPKTKVVLKAKLSSDRPKCHQHQSIKLWRDGELWVGHAKKTNHKGRVKWILHPQKTHRFQARFEGKLVGVHPNRFNCAASRSKKIKIKVVG